jgi:hypothetical protein
MLDSGKHIKYKHLNKAFLPGALYFLNLSVGVSPTEINLQIPLIACSLSIASNKALKIAFTKTFCAFALNNFKE